MRASAPKKSTKPLLQLIVIAALMSIWTHASAAEQRQVVSGDESIVGLPCEGCEAVFQGLPAQLSSSSEIAPQDEPGERMILRGIVRDQRNRPQANIVIYAYQTNQAGVYPRDQNLVGAAARHGRLRAWLRTDANGRYHFQTIRPGSYPNQNIAEHIHCTLSSPVAALIILMI